MGVTAATAFDQATAATPAGPGRYEVLPDPRFAAPAPPGGAAPAVNGGVLLAGMLRAVLAESPHPHPVATSAHFLRVPRIAPALVEVAWLKQGRTAAVARAVLIQDDVPLIDATVTTGSVGDPPPAAGPVKIDFPERTPATPSLNSSHRPPDALTPAPAPAAERARTAADPAALCWTAEPPRFPPAAECVELTPGAGISGQVEFRLDPATAGWLRRQPSGIPEMRGYFRMRDDREPDAYLLAFAVDSLPPVVFGLGAISWAPTVELTWYMRAVPAPGPLRVASRCRHVGAGWFDEEAEVWDAAGRLVAQSRQLARVGRPPAASTAQPFSAGPG